MDNSHNSGTTRNSSFLFSIIILSWNNLEYLENCLQALAKQTYRFFEVILVDNGSIKPVSDDIFAKFPGLSIKFYKLDQNVGFAAGNNYAAKVAEGEYLVTLNADAFPHENWLERMVAAINKYPRCSLASKLIMANDRERLDGEGDVYHLSGLVWRRSYNSPVMESNVMEGEIFSACAAAAVYPRKAFEEVGGFDTDYFAYLEDVDLGFRLRLIGYGCMYIPDAVVYHVGSGSTGRRSNLSVYYGHRNLIWTFYKDMPGIFVFLLAPLNMIANSFLLLLALFRRQGKVAIQSQLDAISGLPQIFKKRKLVQSRRKISPHQIFQWIDINPISPILNSIRRNS